MESLKSILKNIFDFFFKKYSKFRKFFTSNIKGWEISASGVKNVIGQIKKFFLV